MREIKFTTKYDKAPLQFSDENFKIKYEEVVGKDPRYLRKIDGDIKHLAVCPICNNPVVLLGVYKKIDERPHARHTKNIDIPGIAYYNEFMYLHCLYHKGNANYVKEYVPETEEPMRHELYKLAKDNFDKAIYLIMETTGIFINYYVAEKMARNYAEERVYNYIDANLYNIPWYILYSYQEFPLKYLLIEKGCTIYNEIKKLGFSFKRNTDGPYVQVVNGKNYVLKAVNYKYIVDKNDELKEFLEFSITKPDEENYLEEGLHKKVKRFKIEVDSKHFTNLVFYKDWKRGERENKLLEIAAKYMNP